MVYWEVDVDNNNTSSHLECASTTTKTSYTGMVLRNQYGYVTKGHQAIPMDATVLWVDLDDRLDKLHRLCLIVLCLDRGLPTKNNSVLRPSYGFFQGDFHATNVKAMVVATWERRLSFPTVNNHFRCSIPPCT